MQRTHAIRLNARGISARFEELRTLRDGWLDGLGTAPPADGLAWIETALGEHFPENVPLPYIYPVAEGGIQFEWSLGPHEVSLAIDHGRHTGQWHALNLETEQNEARLLNLDNESDWNWLIVRLTDTSRAAP